MRSLIILAACVSVAVCVGGMAELKAVSGDEQYQGLGNAPAFTPQPMGFWGRPRFSPVGYHPLSIRGPSPSFYNGMGWQSGVGRFASYSGTPSPFAVGRGFSDSELAMAAASMSGSADYEDPLAGSIADMLVATRPRAAASPSVSSPSVSSPVVPPSSSISSSMSAATGGFYRGRGNDFAN